MCGWASQPTSVRMMGVLLLCVLLAVQHLWAIPMRHDGIVIALDGEIQTLNPYAYPHKLNAIIDGLIHDQLFFRDPKTLRPVPNLAESLKAVDDLTWEIKLRSHIHFHNGEPVDAAAVKFSIDYLLQADAKFPQRPGFSWLKEVEIVDELSVRLRAHRPVPSLPDVLTRLHVLPPRYCAEVGEEKFAEAPVGAGPYRFVSRKRGGPLMLRANDGYWGGPKGRPSIRTVTFQAVLDPVERFNKLLAGEVHIARGLTIEQTALLNHAGMARVSAKPTPRLVFLLMDGDGRASKTPLTERRVRRAISYALPVEDMIANVLQKFAVRAPGGLTPLYFGYDPSRQPPPFDLSKARSLLSEAGHTEAFEIPLNFSPPAVPGAERLSANIMESLEKVGIKVKIRRFADASEFYTQLREGKLEGLTLLAWGNGASFDSDAVYYPLYHSGQAHAYNTSPELDKLLDEGRATIDPEKRKAIYSALQKLIMEQAYWLPLYGQYVIDGVHRELNYEASSDELMHLSSATWNGNQQPD
ncbi:MAG TPA: ABC transporter substrate-binding protein [Candidatus Tectomicrobia bacterium]|nr:ABC transporter substrate-binding protein [Candidatus Tectomicrobia bacterium]